MKSLKILKLLLFLIVAAFVSCSEKTSETDDDNLNDSEIVDIDQEVDDALFDEETEDVYDEEEGVDIDEVYNGPLEPQNFKVSNDEHNRIVISWDELEDGRVYIYKSDEEDGSFKQEGYTSGDDMIDYDVEMGETYYYKIRVVYSTTQTSRFTAIQSGTTALDASTYEFVESWGEDHQDNDILVEPWGIIFNNDRLLVANTGNNQVNIYRTDGLLINRIFDLESPKDFGIVGPGDIFLAITGGIEESWINFYDRERYFPSYDLIVEEKVFKNLNEPYGVEFDSVSGYGDSFEDAIHPLTVVNNGDNSVTTCWFEDMYYDEGTLMYKDSATKFKSPKGAAIPHRTKGFSRFPFIVDSGNNNVKVMFPRYYNIVNSFGEKGDGDGEFNSPSDVTIDSNGYVFVTDSGNNRVQKFSFNGTFISSFGTSGSGDGEFNNPTGITMDDAGNIFVVDSGNGRIQKFKKSE